MDFLAINTQPYNEVMKTRLTTLEQAVREAGASLDILNQPVTPGENSTDAAAKVMRSYVLEGNLKATVIFGLTEYITIGTARALLEMGIRIPEDLSIVSVVNEGMSRFYFPAITTVEEVDAKPFIRRCIANIESRTWSGPMLLEQQESTLTNGESLGPSRTGELSFC